MQTVYIDVLIVLNIYVNFFLLRITGKLMHFPVKPRRCIAASVYGSIFSLLILAPELPAALLTLIKLAVSLTMILLCFGRHGLKRLIIGTISFYSSNMILAGAIYAVYTWLKPDMVHFGNSYFYIDFSLIVLVITTASLYFIVCSGRYLLDRSADGTGLYEVIVRRGKDITVLSGLADTGNCLVDYFTGAPVIVCDSDKFGESADTSSLPRGYRLIPCSTVSDSGLIPIFRPDEVIIRNSISGKRKSVEAVIGLGKSSGEAVFNPKLLKI